MVRFNCNILNFTETLSYMCILNNNVFKCKINDTQQCDKYFIFPEKIIIQKSAEDSVNVVGGIK